MNSRTVPPAEGEHQPGVLSRMQAPTFTTIPDAVVANVQHFRSLTHAQIMAVVKADGYGHGAVAVAKAAVSAGASWLGLTNAGDAEELRSAGLGTPLLAWLNPAGADAELAAELRVDIAVGSIEELRQLIADARRRVRVHLHMDAGIARGGCPPADWSELIETAREGVERGRIDVVGVMGHLPRADEADPAANAAAVQQMQCARKLATAAFGALVSHLGATSGALNDPATHFDMVRIGAGLVGIDPSGVFDLAGAGRLTASVAHSSLVPSGTAIGYGGTFVTTRETHLAILGLGYADGIPREISPHAGVAVGGRRYPMVGRVSMDQIVIDTGDVAFARGTVATVFGPEGGAVPSIREWANWANTIPHTIVTGIGPRVQRSIA